MWYLLKKRGIKKKIDRVWTDGNGIKRIFPTERLVQARNTEMWKLAFFKK